MPEVFNAENLRKKSKMLNDVLGSASSSIWSSFVACPKHLRFESQHEDEGVVLMGRSHFIVNLGWISIISFAMFVPLFWGEFPFMKALNVVTIWEMTILWYTALGFYAMQSFLLWFYNVYIVTNERLVDVDFMNLLSKTINVTQLSRVEDVNYSQRGILQSMFNYGDVIVQTASEQRTPDLAGEPSAFTFESIGNPDKVAAIISQLIEDEENENNHN